MATAPRPGAGRRLSISQDLKKAENDWIRIKVGRDSFDDTFWMSSIGPADERLCESQTGMSLWDALSNPSGVRPISIIYWFARRKNGEKDLPFHKAQFRDVGDVAEADIDVWFSDPDGDEDVDLEGRVDPTESAAPSETTGPTSPASTDSTPGT